MWDFSDFVAVDDETGRSRTGDPLDVGHNHSARHRCDTTAEPIDLSVVGMCQANNSVLLQASPQRLPKVFETCDQRLSQVGSPQSDLCL